MHSLPWPFHLKESTLKIISSNTIHYSITGIAKSFKQNPSYPSKELAELNYENPTSCRLMQQYYIKHKEQGKPLWADREQWLSWQSKANTSTCTSIPEAYSASRRKDADSVQQQHTLGHFCVLRPPLPKLPQGSSPSQLTLHTGTTVLRPPSPVLLPPTRSFTSVIHHSDVCTPNSISVYNTLYVTKEKLEYMDTVGLGAWHDWMSKCPPKFIFWNSKKKKKKL